MAAKFSLSIFLLMVLCLGILESRYHGRNTLQDFRARAAAKHADANPESSLLNKLRTILKNIQRENNDDGTNTGYDGTNGGNDGTNAGNDGTDAGHDGINGGHDGTGGGLDGTDGVHDGTDGGHDAEKWKEDWNNLKWDEEKENINCTRNKNDLEEENDVAVTYFEWSDGEEHQPCEDWLNADWLKSDKKDKHIINTKSENFRETTYKRNFVKYAKLWPKGKIPYKLIGDTTFQNTIGKRMKEAEALMKQETCVQWIDKDQNPSIQSELGHPDYVKVIAAPNGCYSAVGWVHNEGQGQEIGMDPQGCNNLHTALHEMCHAMGMDHEQSRYDRGNYIKVNLENLDEGMWNNYDREPTEDRAKYDLGSVLQYSDGGKDYNEMTVAVQALSFLTHLDKSLSHYDIQEINQAYKCADHCTNKPTCLNAGFVNHKCQCRCPSGLKGSNCESVDKGTPGKECGDIIEFTTTGVKTITSPNYPGNYGTGRKCVWLIRAPNGYRLKATLKDLDLPYDTDFGKCIHHVEIQFNLLGEIGVRKCAKLASSVVREYKTSVYEQPETMMIKFDSTKTGTAGTGFKIEVEALDTGCTKFPCKQGSTCEDRPNGDFFCKCLEGFTGRHCDEVQDKTVKCDFQWDLSRGCILKTPFRSPFEWHVLSKTRGYMIFVKAETKKYFASLYDYMAKSQGGEKAILTTANVKFDERARCLRFKYYVSGGGTDGGSNGGIIVSYKASGVSRTELWTSSVTNAWKSVQTNVPRVKDLQINFEGIYGDRVVAIDNVQVSPETCDGNVATPQPEVKTTTTKKPTTTTTTTPPPPKTSTTPPSPPTSTSKLCTFTWGETCFMHPVSGSWDNWQGSMTFEGTGPDGSGNGLPADAKGTEFLFLQHTASDVTSEESVLQSGQLENMDYCLSLYYHIASTDPNYPVEGSLTLSSTSGASKTVTQYPEMRWRHVSLFIPAGENLQVTITARRDLQNYNVYPAEIALENLKLTPGQCSSSTKPTTTTKASTTTTPTTTTTTPTTTTTTPTTTTTTPTTTTATPTTTTITEFTTTGTMRCQFEHFLDGCFLHQPNYEQIKWQPDQGSIEYEGTGPDGSGAGLPEDSQGSYYISLPVDYSSSHHYDHASLESNVLENQDYCFSLFYHIASTNPYASKHGILIITSTSGNSEIVHETNSNQWKKVFLNVTAEENLKVFVYAERVGEVDSHAIIAIDDVVLTPGPCAN